MLVYIAKLGEWTCFPTALETSRYVNWKAFYYVTGHDNFVWFLTNYCTFTVAALNMDNDKKNIFNKSDVQTK